MEAASTYRAVQAVGPGRLELTEKTFQAPGPGKVRIRVEACGVCHSDAGTVEALFPIGWPRVPGHDVVGRIDAIGPVRPVACWRRRKPQSGVDVENAPFSLRPRSTRPAALLS